MQRSSKLLVFLLFLNISTANAQGITPIGGGGGGGSGTVTSIATACGVAGGTITTTGTIRGAASDSPVAGTSYSIVDGDCGLIKRSTAAGLTTITAGSPAGFTNPTTWFTTIKSDGAAGVTLTPSGVTIDGSGSSITIATGKSLDLYSDGTNYHTLPGNSAGTGTVTTTGSPANGNLTQFSGATSITNGNLSGNCVTNGTLATTCDAPHPGYIASNWYFPLGTAASTANGSAVGQNVIACTYGVVARTITVSQLGVRVQTAGSTNSQFAIYTNSSGSPGALIAATGSVANTGAGTNVSAALSANKQIGPGGADGGRDIWFCVNQNDSTVTYSVPISSNSFGSSYLGATSLANLISSGPIFTVGKSCNGASCQGGSSTFGSWPASLATSTWTYVGGVPPLVGFLVASVP